MKAMIVTGLKRIYCSPSLSFLLPSRSLFLSVSDTRCRRDTLTRPPASPVNSALRIIAARLRTTICARRVARHETGKRRRWHQGARRLPEIVDVVESRAAGRCD